MRRSQLTGLVVGAAALFFTARPAQAQVWFGPPVVRPPVVIAPPPVVIAPPPVVVARPPVVVGPGWGARPYWGVRYYRPVPRGGWYRPAWGPRGGVVYVGRRW
jgi:hypothetical protein